MPIVKGFRRFHSNFVSSRQGAVVTEISNLVSGSNVEQSERSSTVLKKPIRKKVASADRRAMLESFVNKYRAMNQGKFPSPSSAQKEIGGGYYKIRKMIQEMEYDFNKSPVENEPEKENKKKIKSEVIINNEIGVESSGSQQESNSQITIGQQLCKDQDPLLESVNTNFKLKEEIQPSASSGDSGNNNVITDYIATKSHDRISQCEEDSESKLENPNDEIRNIMREVSSGSQEKSNSQITIDQQLCDDTNLKLEEIQPSTSNADSADKIAKKSDDRVGQFNELNMKEDSKSKVENQDNITREQEKEVELSEKASLWGNLKSLATGFINIWRKS